MYVHAGAHVMSYIAEILTMIVHENNKTFAAGRAIDGGGASPLFPFMMNLALASITFGMKETVAPRHIN